MLHNLQTLKTRLIQSLFMAGFAILCLPIAAQQRAVYKNPVIPGDFPDPSVIRVGEDYWAMTTTGTWAPHFPALHSRDLVNWRIVGYVFQQKPAWVKSDFWAPEIVHDRGRFLVYYTARREEGAGKVGTLCVAVATASRTVRNIREVEVVKSTARVVDGDIAEYRVELKIHFEYEG